MKDHIVYRFLTNPPAVPTNETERYIVKNDTDAANKFYNKQNYVISANFSNPSYPKWDWERPDIGDTAQVIECEDPKSWSLYIFKNNGWELQITLSAT